MYFGQGTATNSGALGVDNACWVNVNRSNQEAVKAILK